MTHEEMSNFTHEELSYFSHAELSLDKILLLQKIVSDESIDIPQNIQIKIYNMCQTALSEMEKVGAIIPQDSKKLFDHPITQKIIEKILSLTIDALAGFLIGSGIKVGIQHFSIEYNKTETTKTEYITDGLDNSITDIIESIQKETNIKVDINGLSFTK